MDPGADSEDLRFAKMTPLRSGCGNQMTLQTTVVYVLCKCVCCFKDLEIRIHGSAACGLEEDVRFETFTE